jgi:LmbE family N-acetylglucosaminyl deacetylase
MTHVIPTRALVIMAHPDEIEYFVGGTVAVWTAAGCAVTFLLLTNGDKGSQEPTMTPERLMKLREAEQRAAAEVLGVQSLVFLREPDGGLAATPELRKRVTAEIRRHRPDAVIAPDPLGYFHHPIESHPDLFPTGQVALDAVTTTAGNRLFYPDLLEAGLEPYRVRDLWLASAIEPNYSVDITATISRKVRALCCHQTQVPDPAALESRLYANAQSTNEQGQTVYREWFRCIRIHA